MADDINIDPALSQPASSVVSDLTPLASPALSPFATPAPQFPSTNGNSSHNSTDIAVPSAPHVNGSSNNADDAQHSSSSNNNSNNNNNADVPVPQLHQPLPPKPPLPAANAGVKRKVDDTTIMRCPYRESKKCKKEYKHKNAMRYHLEQAHAQEPDIQQNLADYPAQPPSKKAKTAASKAMNNSYANRQSSLASSSLQRNNVPQSANPTTTAPNPFFGLFTHGYVFSSAGIPFRPHNRPIDALYYLNILSTAGIKSQQQRASERLMINALLNADFIKHLQDNVNIETSSLHQAYHLDLLDDKGMLKQPIAPIQPSSTIHYSPYTKRDADSAILKLAKTLQDVGLGDGIDNAQYF